MSGRTEQKVKLLVVDDHEVVRLGLINLFDTFPKFAVVAEAGTAVEAVEKARECHPDLVVLDLRLPDGSGIDVCRKIRFESRNTHVLVLTSYDEPGVVLASLAAGATGFVHKEASTDRLLQAVDMVAEGYLVFDPVAGEVVSRQASRAEHGQAGDPLAGLREQEIKILELVSEGKTNREIAALLFLSEHTVKTYVSNILRKLQVNRRSEAAATLARRR